jgi:hypothetical protein
MTGYRKAWLGVAALLSVLATVGPAGAQLADENLLQPLPRDFAIGFRTTHGEMVMTEAVPVGETVQAWTRMITTQMFRGRRDMQTAPFLSGIGRQWLAACAGSVAPVIHTGDANGYVVSMMLLTCPLNPATGKPETTLFRAIKGADSFYVVQYAYRSIPTPERIEAAAHYLGGVNVCDTRTAAHPCRDMQGFKAQ